MQSNKSGPSRRFFLQSAAAVALASGLSHSAFAAGTIKPDAKSALIVVDVQNCFVEGGTLPVKGGSEVVPVINAIARVFANIVITQDWHTPEHASFASSHTGKKPFETAQMPYGTQVLWPDHCVQGTDDAALVSGLNLTRMFARHTLDVRVDVQRIMRVGVRQADERAGGVAGHYTGDSRNTPHGRAVVRSLLPVHLHLHHVAQAQSLCGHEQHDHEPGHGHHIVVEGIADILAQGEHEYLAQHNPQQRQHDQRPA